MPLFLRFFRYYACVNAVGCGMIRTNKKSVLLLKIAID